MSFPSMCALMIHLDSNKSEALLHFQQDAEGAEEAKVLPLLESLAALEAAWQGADQETVISSSATLSRHVAFALQPGKTHVFAFTHLPLGALSFKSS